MGRWDRLVWTWRRLGRMSAPEVAYRLWEQFKRAGDRGLILDWSAFGHFPGEVAGLPDFDVSAAAVAPLKSRLTAASAAAIAGRFAFLGQDWPASPDAQDRPWWDGDLWLLDPHTHKPWPGAARFAFDVAYRHCADRGDVKRVWELNRLQFLPPLALQAALTGGDGALVFQVLEGWMRANPPYRGVNWAGGVEAASRVVSLLAALAFVQPRTDRHRATTRAFLQAHVAWIARYPSRFSSANNHRAAELAALFLATTCAPSLANAARLRARAQAGLERQALRLFHADGVGAEQSVAYAAYALEWVVVAGLVGEAAGRPFSAAFRERARLALHHLRWMLDPAGHAPRIGDGDDGRVLALTQAMEPRYAASVAAMTARWLGEPALAEGTTDPALRDLLGAQEPAGPSPTGVRTFPSGGLTVWRRARPDGLVLLAFDHGPLGHLSIAAHGHADALAVWLHWGGEAVLIDPGTQLYHAPDSDRDALRGTAAHNTLTLEGRDQSRIVGPFAWADHARARLVAATAHEAAAEHDGYRRRFRLIHHRRVRFDQDAILIEDRLVGPGRAALPRWSLGFTLDPALIMELTGGVAHIRTPSGRRLLMIGEAADGVSLAWTARQVVYAPAFGSRGLTMRLELSGVKERAPLVARTRIVLNPPSPG